MVSPRVATREDVQFNWCKWYGILKLHFIAYLDIPISQNSAKRLQKEHFNCMVYAALVTLLQHVLSKFNTTNSLACIICSFENLEYLRVLAEVMHRGEMFEFGEESYDQDNPRMIRNLDQEKLKNASVNNMDSERAVASVNYGLKIMGAQEIKAVSSSPVKTKAVDLMDGRRLR
ncbi:hypothetical protein EMCRGX_G032727 [Ephydatia muelleri]